MSLRNFYLSVIAFLLVTIQLWSQSYESREGDSIFPKFYIKAGFYSPTLRTSLRVDGRNLGTDIGLEDELGFSEDLGVFRTDVYWNISKNSTIDGTYTYIKRNRSVTLEEDVEFNDIVFEAGSGIDFNFDVDYIAATYRYNFFNELNWNAGASVGLRGVIINTGIEGRLNDIFRSASANFVAPALLIGIHGSAYLTPRLLARYSLEGLYLEIEGIGINIIESNAGVTWYFSKHIGIGLSYATNDYRVDDLPFSDDFQGRVNFSFSGLNLYLEARF
jgi:hypothetical protein